MLTTRSQAEQFMTLLVLVTWRIERQIHCVQLSQKCVSNGFTYYGSLLYKVLGGRCPEKRYNLPEQTARLECFDQMFHAERNLKRESKLDHLWYWYLSEDFSYELRFSHFQVEKCSLSSLDNYPVGILTAVPWSASLAALSVEIDTIKQVFIAILFS